MKKIFISSFILLILGSLCLAFAGAKPKRVFFKKRQTQINVRGYLKSLKDSDRYVLRVRSGQSIEVRPSCGGTLGVRADVLNAAGQSIGDNDMQGNSGFENTTAGDYIISVAPSGKDDRHRGGYCLNIKVIEYKSQSSVDVPIQFDQIRFEKIKAPRQK